MVFLSGLPPIFALFLLFSQISSTPLQEKVRLKRASPSKGNPRHRVVSAEAVDLIVSHRNSIDTQLTDQRLFGTFSPVGFNYETSGDVVQVSSFRACDAKRKGLDRTVFGHVAVLFVDEVQPFLTGCVALDNQARFAEKSGALALVVGPASRVQNNLKPLRYRAAKIPVIVLDDNETERLRAELSETSQAGSVARLNIQFIDSRPPYTLRLQVFRPTALNLALIGLLVVLVLFISGLVFIKIRCKPNVHRDIWMRALARSALHKMEIRKYSKTAPARKPSRLSRLSRSRPTYLPVFGSLTSVAHTVAGQDRCSICLEDYKEGSELRVLFCGHEFHPKCVDPWLLANRRCPLCQFDVVYKEYPNTDDNNKTSSDENTPTAPLLPQAPFTPVRISNRHSVHILGSAVLTSNQRPISGVSIPIDPEQSVGHTPSQRPKRTPTRTRSVPRRRPLRSREELLRVTVGPLGHVSGYSSDVSSYPDVETVNRVVL